MIVSPVACKIVGRCVISDDLGNIILDKTNKIHSTNFSRVFARSLAHEQNCFINKFAFGNGGTYFSATGTHKPKNHNNGILDRNRYKSRLYNETYAEYVDESSTTISFGNGSKPNDDPTSVINSEDGPGVISKEFYDADYKDYSQVVVTCVLNKNEPTSQYLTDLLSDTTDIGNTVFEFDEIGLFTSGLESEIPTSGYQTITFNTPNTYVKTGLEIGKEYTLTLIIDGEERIFIYVPEDVSSIPEDNYIRYKDLVSQLNKYLTGVTVSMDTGDSKDGKHFGYMTISSKTVGPKSFVKIKPDFSNKKWIFNNIPLFSSLNESIYGKNVGAQNDANHPENEYARMLTHLIFEPIRKPANRTYIFKYYLDIFVQP